MNGRIKMKQWKRFMKDRPWDDYDDEMLSLFGQTREEYEKGIAEKKAARKGRVSIAGRRAPCKDCGKNACGFFLRSSRDDRTTAYCKKCAGSRDICTRDSLDSQKELSAFVDRILGSVIHQTMNEVVWNPIMTDLGLKDEWDQINKTMGEKGRD